MAVPTSPVWVDELPDVPDVGARDESPRVENTTEEFRDVLDPVYTDDEGNQHIAYQVSNLANVKALQRPGMRSEFMVAQWVQQGHPYVKLRVRKSVSKSFRVDELVANAFLGERPGPSWVIGYADDDKLNVEASNLSWNRSTGNPPAWKKHHRMQEPIPVETQVAAAATDPATDGYVDQDHIHVVVGDEGTQADYEIFEPQHALREQHWYIMGDIEVIVAPEGTFISRLEDIDPTNPSDERRVIESISLTPEQRTDLVNILDRVV